MAAKTGFNIRDFAFTITDRPEEIIFLDMILDLMDEMEGW